MYLKDTISRYIDDTNLSFCSFTCLCRHKSQSMLGKPKGFREFVLEEIDTVKITSANTVCKAVFISSGSE